MSVFTTIETKLASIGHDIATWFTPEEQAAIAFFDNVMAEAERIGPQLLFDTVTAAATTALATGGSTGAILSATVDSAVATLKAEGKTDITATVASAAAAAITTLNTAAAAQGVTVSPAPAPAPEPAPAPPPEPVADSPAA